jgi:hypothetical protein
VSRNAGSWAIRYGYATYKDCSFESEKDVRIRAQVLAPKTNASSAPLLIYIKRASDSFYGSDMDEILPLLGHYTVVMLNPRLTEQSMTPAEYTDVERTAVWAGRTIAAMQVWDVLRTIQWAAEEKLGGPVSLYGKGDMAAVALYAALFDDRAQQVVLNATPASHWEGPALLNVLRVTDIAEVAAAVAPHRLVSVTKLPGPFDFAKDVYRLNGVSKQFVHADSLPEALEIWRH